MAMKKPTIDYDKETDVSSNFLEIWTQLNNIVHNLLWDSFAIDHAQMTILIPHAPLSQSTILISSSVKP